MCKETTSTANIVDSKRVMKVEVKVLEIQLNISIKEALYLWVLTGMCTSGNDKTDNIYHALNSIFCQYGNEGGWKGDNPNIAINKFKNDLIEGMEQKILKERASGRIIA